MAFPYGYNRMVSVGDVADLDTTAKNTLVNAINELNTNAGDLTTLKTTEQTSLVGATNELKDTDDALKLRDAAEVKNKVHEIIRGHYKEVTGYGSIAIPNNAKGQISASQKGRTWTNRAGAGDTSPQTVSGLDSTKTYLLINSANANVEIDTVDTATPVKITGATEFDFVWASGNIAVYELSTVEAALDASVLGARYNYVSGTKSTFCGSRFISVDKNKVPTTPDAWEQGGFDASGAKALFTTRLRTKNPFVLESSVQHFAKAFGSGYAAAALYFYDRNKNFISPVVTSFPTTTPSNAYYANCTIRKVDESVIVVNDVTVAQPQVEKGATATEYEPHANSKVYLPAFDSNGDPIILRRVPSAKDELCATQS